MKNSLSPTESPIGLGTTTQDWKVFMENQYRRETELIKYLKSGPQNPKWGEIKKIWALHTGLELSYVQPELVIEVMFKYAGNCGLIDFKDLYKEMERFTGWANLFQHEEEYTFDKYDQMWLSYLCTVLTNAEVSKLKGWPL